MPSRIQIDNRTYQTHHNPGTDKWFVASVSEPDDAGRLLPGGMILWFDPHRHDTPRQRVEALAYATIATA